MIKQSSPTFVRVIEAALQFGNPVLLENIVETIDPVLEPVLLKQVVVIGGAATIKLGDATVDYDPKFRLYLTTKLRNPVSKGVALSSTLVGNGSNAHSSPLTITPATPRLLALPARVMRESEPAQLHGHGGGPGRPDAGHRHAI